MHFAMVASAAAAVLALSSAAATNGRVSVLAVRSSKQPTSILGGMESDSLDKVTVDNLDKAAVANLGANRLKARGVGEHASRAPDWHHPPPQQEANWSVLFPSQAPGATGPHSHPLAPAPAQLGPEFAAPYAAPYHPAYENTWNHVPPPVQNPQWNHPTLQPAVYPPPQHGYNAPQNAYYPPQSTYYPPQAPPDGPSPVQVPPFFPTYQTQTDAPGSASQSHQPHQPHQPAKPAKPSKPPGSPTRPSRPEHPCSPTRPPRPPRRPSPPHHYGRPHHSTYTGSGGYYPGGRYGRDDYFNGYVNGETDAQIMEMATGPSRPSTSSSSDPCCAGDDCCRDCCTPSSNECTIM